ncbi:unnamed protein product [Rhizoctonia solani]|uniref:Survival protein SurE-like phosphatase/nucleotidase domain-containing protein n=1 Tax=Rhizoctonia solani TaxID=456999 RepID=A0A8H3CUT2_9AGAM|nr:unnamed protein product [Rhizoctonia solani]CAE6500136.1 unnamed protein product [Rhizoctonia solani]
MTRSPIRVLLTNDDGPPSNDSPYVLGLYLELKKLGWDVRVVIPASQKSWIGGWLGLVMDRANPQQYVIRDVIHGQYFYPKEDGTGEKCDKPRPLEDGEVGEWVLLEGTPATCTNIALHTLYPGEIDLVVSGPNFGRNTGTAFVLSSGTIGAAMSSALSQTRSIALSYATFEHASPPEHNAAADALAGRIIKQLWENWGTDKNGLRLNEVDLYNVNIPMTEQLLKPGGVEVCWTTVWANSYAKLFKPQSEGGTNVSAAGPDAPPATASAPVQSSIPSNDQLQLGQEKGHLTSNQTSISAKPQPPKLAFAFAYSPDKRNSNSPALAGTDAWAINRNKSSVTPLRAGFCPGGEGEEIAAGTIWKW